MFAKAKWNIRLFMVLFLSLCLCSYAETDEEYEKSKRKVVSILNQKGKFDILRHKVAEELVSMETGKGYVLRVLKGIEPVYTGAASVPLGMALFSLRYQVPVEWLRVMMADYFLYDPYSTFMDEDEFTNTVLSLRGKTDRELIEFGFDATTRVQKAAVFHMLRERLRKNNELVDLMVRCLAREVFKHKGLDRSTEHLLLFVLAAKPDEAKKAIADALKRKSTSALLFAAACFKMEEAHRALKYLEVPAEDAPLWKEDLFETALEVFIVYPTPKAFPALMKILERIDVKEPPSWLDKALFAAAYCKPPDERLSLKRFIVDGLLKKEWQREALFMASFIADDKTILEVLQKRMEERGCWVYGSVGVEIFILLDRERALKVFRLLGSLEYMRIMLYLYEKEEFCRRFCERICAEGIYQSDVMSIRLNLEEERCGLSEKLMEVASKRLVEDYNNRRVRFNLAYLLSIMFCREARYFALQLLFDPDPAVRAVVEKAFKDHIEEMEGGEEEWIAKGFPRSALGKIGKNAPLEAKWAAIDWTYSFTHSFGYIEPIVERLKKLYEREWFHFFYAPVVEGTAPTIMWCEFGSDSSIDPYTKEKLTEEQVEREKKRIEKLKALMRELEELQYAEWAEMDVKKWRELTDEEKEKIKEKLRKEK